MIHEVAQIHEIDILPIDPLVFDQLQFHGNRQKILGFDIVIVVETSIPIESHHVQDTVTFITNEGTRDLFTIQLSKTIAMVLFPDPTLEIDSASVNAILHIASIKTTFSICVCI